MSPGQKVIATHAEVLSHCYVVSALLFVFGLGFVVVGAGEAKRAPAAAAAPAAPAAAPLATTM